MLTIINYNAGNPSSIKNMLKRIGISCSISSDPSEIRKAEKLILPGVGSFDFGMSELNRMGLSGIIREKALTMQTPILGICLGAQLMGNVSEEGELPGLGLINMEVKRFSSDRLSPSQKIPHMGWNYIKIAKNSQLLANLEEEPRFYFVHSYHFVLGNANDVLTTTEYGYEFVSSFQNDNIAGVQFHPEKSHKFGMQLLKNFIAL